MVNAYPLTVIGVSQAGFDGVQPGYSPQIRVPLTMHDTMTRFPTPNWATGGGGLSRCLGG